MTRGTRKVRRIARAKEIVWTKRGSRRAGRLFPLPYRDRKKIEHTFS